MADVKTLRVRGCVALAILLSLTAVACSGNVQPAAKRTPADSTSTRAAPSGNAGSVMLGAWVATTESKTPAHYQAAVMTLEQQIGRKLAIDSTYVPAFTAPEKWIWRPKGDVANGRLPLVTIGAGASTAKVTAGGFDLQIKVIAAALKALHHPVLVRYGNEPDGTVNHYWVESPRSYIAAWQHVHRLFAGVPVQWVWTLNAIAFDGQHGGADQYWPGSSYVDWIGADGYNWATCHVRDPWTGFYSIFRGFAAWGAGKSKKLIVSEFGSVEDPAAADRKAAWLEDIPAALRRLPEIRAVVYFDSDRDCHWRLDSSPAALKGFAQLGAAPELQGRPDSIGN